MMSVIVLAFTLPVCRHVLRFYGQFQEAVVETNLENYRPEVCEVAHCGRRRENVACLLSQDDLNARDIVQKSC